MRPVGTLSVQVSFVTCLMWNGQNALALAGEPDQLSPVAVKGPIEESRAVSSLAD